MPPQEEVSPEFDWEEDRRAAHTKIESASPEAASALAKALDSAFQMADLCQRAIARGPGAWQEKSAPPPAWVDFLESISNDAEFFYSDPGHLSALPKELRDPLLTRFADIAVAALEAQTRITTMPRPSPEASKKAVVILRTLMKHLRAAERILVPSPEGEVTNLAGPGTGEEPEIPAPSEAVLVPLVGRIAAGSPNLAEQAVEDIFPLPRQVLGTGDLFLLKVYSHSMTGAGIMEGDWVVIRRQPVAENGDIVVALVDGDATIKKYEMSGGKVTLLAQNPIYDDILGNRATIMGKVVAVFRKM